MNAKPLLLAALLGGCATTPPNLQQDLAQSAIPTAWKKGQVIYPQTKHIYIDIGGPASLRHSLEELKTAFAKSRRPQIGAATTARSRAC